MMTSAGGKAPPATSRATSQRSAPPTAGGRLARVTFTTARTGGTGKALVGVPLAVGLGVRVALGATGCSVAVVLAVAVGEGVPLAVSVGEGVSLALPPMVGVPLGVPLAVPPAVGLPLGVPLELAPLLGVRVGVSVALGVREGVREWLLVGESVGVRDGVELGLPPRVGVSVGVCDGVDVGLPPREGVGLGLLPRDGVGLGLPPREGVGLAEPPRDAVPLGVCVGVSVGLGDRDGEAKRLSVAVGVALCEPLLVVDVVGEGVACRRRSRRCDASSAGCGCAAASSAFSRSLSWPGTSARAGAGSATSASSAAAVARARDARISADRVARPRCEAGRKGVRFKPAQSGWRVCSRRARAAIINHSSNSSQETQAPRAGGVRKPLAGVLKTTPAQRNHTLLGAGAANGRPCYAHVAATAKQPAT